MAAPGSFILLAGVLLLSFAACMLTGAVWFFFGWKKKARSVQFLSALPFGVGLLIIAPLLVLALIMVGLWLIADWQEIPPPPSSPAPQEQKKPNEHVPFGLLLDALSTQFLSDNRFHDP